MLLQAARSITLPGTASGDAPRYLAYEDIADVENHPGSGVPVFVVLTLHDGAILRMNCVGSVALGDSRRILGEALDGLATAPL